MALFSRCNIDDETLFFSLAAFSHLDGRFMPFSYRGLRGNLYPSPFFHNALLTNSRSASKYFISEDPLSYNGYRGGDCFLFLLWEHYNEVEQVSQSRRRRVYGKANEKCACVPDGFRDPISLRVLYFSAQSQ